MGGQRGGGSKPQWVFEARPANAKPAMGVFGPLVQIVASLLIVSYCIYLYDEEGFKSRAERFGALKPLVVIFHAVEVYSPFHEYLGDKGLEKEELKAAGEPKKDSGVLTPYELKGFDGSDGGKIYLALMGEVFDVSRGRNHYGPGMGYSFFAGRDGSRAFVTGQFDDEGLTDDVMGLELSNYHDLDEWRQLYRKDYTHIGFLRGRYFDEEGHPTDYHSRVQELIAKSHHVRDEKKAEREVFPPCNSRWSGEDGHKVWCTKKSGGIARGWVGVPRRLFSPGGKDERCACVKDFGEPHGGQPSENRGDLNHPNLKEFPNCDPKLFECQLSPPYDAAAGQDDAATQPL